MSLITKIKNFFGIGGVKVELQVSGQVAQAEKEISGKVVLTTKSEQEIKDLEVILEERFTSGRGDDEKSRTFELGKVKIPVNRAIKPGDSQEIAFNLPFKILKSTNDGLIEKGGALGKLGKLSKWASAEKSEYYVKAMADVLSASFDPEDEKSIQLV